MPIKHSTTASGGESAGLLGQNAWNADHDLSSLSTADVPDSLNRRYVTDAQRTVIGNTSGTNTGDQTITLTGDVTGSGTGSFATTLVNAASLPTSDPVTTGKLWNNNGIPTISAARGTLLGYSGPIPFGALDNAVRFRPSTGANVSVIGAASTSAGTISTISPSSGSITNRAYRTRAVSSASAGSNAGVGSGSVLVSVTCGIRAELKFNLQATDTSGFQFFAGLKGSSSILAGDPSSNTHVFGVGYDAADNAGTNWQIIYNGAGTATRVDTGIPRVTGNTCLLILECYNSTTWDYYFADLTAGTAAATGTVSSGTPGNTQLMAIQCSARNGAIASATGHEIHAMDVMWKAS